MAYILPYIHVCCTSSNLYTPDSVLLSPRRGKNKQTKKKTSIVTLLYTLSSTLSPLHWGWEFWFLLLLLSVLLNIMFSTTATSTSSNHGRTLRRRWCGTCPAARWRAWHPWTAWCAAPTGHRCTGPDSSPRPHPPASCSSCCCVRSHGRQRRTWHTRSCLSAFQSTSQPARKDTQHKVYLDLSVRSHQFHWSSIGGQVPIKVWVT